MIHEYALLPSYKSTLLYVVTTNPSQEWHRTSYTLTLLDPHWTHQLRVELEHIDEYK